MTSMEAFFDLVFVLPMNQMMNIAMDDEYFGVLRYILVFATVIWGHTGETMYNTRFDPDDLVTRIGTLVQMMGVAAMASGISNFLVTADATFQWGYVALRAVLVLKYVRAWVYLPSVRSQSGPHIAGFGLAVLCWALSSVAKNRHSRTALCIAGLAIDYGTPWLILLSGKQISAHGGHFSKRFTAIGGLFLAGNLFAVTRSMPPQTEQEWLGVRGKCTLLGVSLPLTSYRAGMAL